MATKLGSGPHGVGTKHWLGINKVPLQHCANASIGAIANVAERNECIATQPHWVAIGQIPTAVRIDERIVGGFEHVEQGHPRLNMFRLVDRCLALETHRRRTHDLALIAPVDAIAKGGAKLPRKHTRALQQPRQATPSIDHTWRHNGRRWTAIDASLA